MFELLGTAAMFAVATPLFVNWIANFNILFTKVREGSAKAIMTGESFEFFVMSHKGHHLNDPRKRWYSDQHPAWEVLPDEDGTDYDDRSWIWRKIGVYFVGIPPFRRVYKYHFVWNEERTNPEGDMAVWTRDRHTDFIYIAHFPYMPVIKSAETAEGIPVDAFYQLTVAINNPHMALFGSEDWMVITTGAANRAGRNYIGASSYQEIISETSRSGSSGVHDSFGSPIVRLNKKLPDQPEESELGLQV